MPNLPLLNAAKLVRMERQTPRIDRRAFELGAASTLAASRTAQAASARIEIAGAELRRDGVPLRLLGVAVGDPIYIRQGRPLSDYRVIADVWRANTGRISLHPGHWRADRDKALNALAADVTAARAAGLLVIVCWHAIGFPGHFT